LSSEIRQQLTEAGPQGGVRMLRMPEVRARTGLSVPSIYRLIGEGRFPRQVPLSTIAIGFVESEVDTWLAERIAERDGAEAPAE
jgi:prophage regulatory protein